MRGSSHTEDRIITHAHTHANIKSPRKSTSDHFSPEWSSSLHSQYRPTLATQSGGIPQQFVSAQSPKANALPSPKMHPQIHPWDCAPHSCDVAELAAARSLSLEAVHKAHHIIAHVAEHLSYKQHLPVPVSWNLAIAITTRYLKQSLQEHMRIQHEMVCCRCVHRLHLRSLCLLPKARFDSVKGVPASG